MARGSAPASYGLDPEEIHGCDDQFGGPKARFHSASSTPDEKKKLPDDDDANMDALIADLVSEDGRMVGEAESFHEPGGAPTMPNELFQTNPKYGLTDSEVLARGKRYGWNKMKEEKENLFLKFLSYFVGPIQFVMEVRHPKRCLNLTNYL